MDILFDTSGDKNSIDQILLLCNSRLSDIVQRGRKEFAFAMDGISGKFRTYYPFPGRKKLDILFKDAAENQLDEIEETGNELLASADHATVSLKMEKPANGLGLTKILSQQFISALHLSLKNNAGISIRSGDKRLEILSGLRGNNSVMARNCCGLKEKRISQLNKEAQISIRQALALSDKMVTRDKIKKFPMPLKSDDLKWRNVVGTSPDSAISYIEKNAVKHYRSEASAGFGTFKSDLTNLFSDVFFNTVRNIDTIDALVLEKDTGGKRCSVSVSKNNDSAYEGLTSANVTVELALGVKKTFSIATEPEVIRLLNAVYVTAMDNVDLKEAFTEYILNNANSTCICGKKFKDTLKKEIIEIGCYSQKKHLIHRSCWNKWKKINKPKQYNWVDSFCPFCGNDSSIYNTPWNNGKLIWKSAGN